MVKNKTAAKSSTDHVKGSQEKKKSWLSIFDKNASWDDRDEVLDAVYWFRQILSLFMGILWGFLNLTGFVGIISFCILNSIAAYAIANNTGYEFDPDESLLSVKEGFMATFATFLVSWIVTYTSVHSGDSN